jgi:hypothetical protein
MTLLLIDAISGLLMSRQDEGDERQPVGFLAYP